LESEVTIRTEELRHASIFQQVLIDVLPVPVFYMDSEGRSLGCNNSFEKLFGQKREQTNGKSVYELFPKELADIYHEKNLALLQNPRIQTYETTIKDGKGVDHNVIFHKATFPHTDGSVGGLIGAILDITDLKLAEKALRVSEEKYRIVVENAKEAIIVTQDMKVVFVNNAGVDMIKYSEKVLKPKPFTDFIHPDDCNMVIDHHLRRLKGEEVQSVYSFRVLSQDGTVRWVELNAAAIKWKERPATLSFLKDITERKLAEANLQQTLNSLQKAVGATIQVMVSAVEMRDPYTAGHQLRVANLACAIATEMGLPQDKIDGIRMAGSIHDIGKLSIPAEILSKPTKLTNIEYSLIKEHPLSGYEMLKDVESPWPLAQVVYQHHERMDGSGYPRNLKGDEIIMEARIMAVADVVEAMASHRPYRAGLGIDAALAEIEKNRGTHYDNTVVDACLRLFREKGYQLT
jgi:PAS domain S-box-containing protein